MKVTREKMAIICLMLGMFFNPFGYDAIFKMVLDATDSYWTTVHIFYLIAVSFLGLYFYLAKINPVVAIKNKIVKIYKKSMVHFSK